jgi:predicted transcriptional regulator
VKEGKYMNLKFWKKKEAKESGPNPHDELDPEIEEIPEFNHDIVLSLLRDSDSIRSREFVAKKYGLTPLHLKEYTDFLVQKDLLRIYVKRDGKIDRVELTEKGKLFIAEAEISKEAKASIHETGA